jgi:hypothetical protein
MISNFILLSNHACTGVIHARQVRVTNVVHRHIKMTGKTWGLTALGSIVIHHNTIISTIRSTIRHCLCVWGVRVCACACACVCMHECVTDIF